LEDNLRAETRCYTQSKYYKKRKIFKSNDYTNLARHFASFNPINENESEILLDYKKIDRLIKSIAEFAYQVFKILSIERGFEWKIT